MAVVDDNGPPPAELRLAWMCARFNCLPKAGGLMDQDYRTMHRMVVFDNVHNAQNKLRHAVGKEIHNCMSPGEWEIIAWLRKNGIGVGMRASGV